ncbi:MAG TPA: PAS domain-containing protein [Beijerinckiaceae bacterium]
MTLRAEADRIASEIERKAGGSDPFAAAVRATRMPMLITDPRQPDNPIIFVNDAFCRLTGYAREEILGRNCRFLQGPETDQRDVDRIREAIANQRSIELDLLNHKKNGEVFWNRLLIAPVFDEHGSELLYFFASQFDVTLERDRLVRLQRDRDSLEAVVERRTFDLGQSEERLRFALKAGRLGSWSLDLATRQLVTSEGFRENFGLRPSDPCGYEDAIAAIPEEDRARVLAAVDASVAQRSDYDLEHRILTPSGEVRWVHIRGQPAYRADGTPLSLAGVSLDVTDRKRAEEHRALLARELDHRVKNTLATLQAIANQTLRTAASIEEARETLSARIQSLAAAHDVLTRESWNGAAIAEVVDGALAAFRSGNARRLRTSGPDLRLPPRIALALAMALHELATNAAKYGALSNEIGHVRFDWDVIDGSNGERLWLRWEEFGGPPVTPPTRRGFGSRLIERTLATELGGTAEVDYRSKGLVFTAEAPLPDPREEDGARLVTPADEGRSERSAGEEI